MVKKVIALMKKEVGGLHEAAYLLAFFTFLSQVLAVVRDRILAGTFGAGSILDVYYASFKIPDTVFVSLASLVSASIIIPFIIEKEKDGKESVHKFLNSVFSCFFILLSISSLIIFFFTPQILKILFPDFFTDFRGQEAVFFTRIMLIQPILLGISNFISGAVQSRGRFFAYALSPLFYNLGIIFGVIFLYPLMGNNGLAWGVVLGALLHLIIQLPAVYSIKLFPHFTKDVDFKEILRVFRLSLPRTIALASNNLSTLVLISMASSLGFGAIAVFTFGWNLQSVPLAIVGASYSMAAFPTLARLFSEKNEEKFLEVLKSSVNHIIFWSMPFLSLFIVLRAQIVRVILGSGKFDWEDTRLTAATLAIFSISIVAQGVIVILTRAYYSRGKTKFPLVVNLLSAVSIPVFTFIFIKIFNFYPVITYFFGSLLRISEIKSISIISLPIGYSLGTIMNAGLLWFMFRGEIKNWDKGVISNFLHSFCASVIGAFVTYLSLNFFDNLFNLNKTFGIFGQGFFSGILGLIVTIIFLKLMGSEILKETQVAFKKVFYKAPQPISSDFVEGQNRL